VVSQISTYHEQWVMGGPGLDFQTWETLEAGVGENEKRRVGAHRLTHLKIEMWATRPFAKCAKGWSTYS
jgi:hypothetical protein